MQLTPWKLEADDTKLLDLLPFLEAVVRTAVPDVRAVVRSYEGEDIPTAFRCGLCQDVHRQTYSRDRVITVSHSMLTSARGICYFVSTIVHASLLLESTLLPRRERMARVQALKQQSRGFLGGLGR